MLRLRKIFLQHKTLIVSIGFLTLFSFAVTYATPPGSPYNAGQTLDPACVPGSSNCTVTISGGGTSYTFSTGLTNTANTITSNLSTGVSGGQSVVGGTAASNNLTLSSTTNSTKGKILFGTSGYNEANNRLGIGTNTPSAALDLEGDGAILALGTLGSGLTAPNLGAGTRLEWIPSKAAFRAGTVLGTEWDNSNVGQYSVAIGYGSTASGDYSEAFGGFSSALAPGAAALAGGYATGLNAVAIGGAASGQNSTALPGGNATGQSSVSIVTYGLASGNFAVSLARSATASGIYSLAAGSYSTASAYASSAFGQFTTGDSYTSAAFGQYNIGGGNPDDWIATDPLFEIGNGINSSNKADALLILKNGNTTINGDLNVTGNVTCGSGCGGGGGGSSQWDNVTGGINYVGGGVSVGPNAVADWGGDISNTTLVGIHDISLGDANTNELYVVVEDSSNGATSGLDSNGALGQWDTSQTADDGSGNTTQFDVTNSTSDIKLSLSANNGNQTVLWPTAPDDGSVPYKFDTFTQHTTGDLFDINNSGTPELTFDNAGNLFVQGNITCGGSCGGGSSQWNDVSGGISYTGGDAGLTAGSFTVGSNIANDWGASPITNSSFVGIHDTSTGDPDNNQLYVATVSDANFDQYSSFDTNGSVEGWQTIQTSNDGTHNDSINLSTQPNNVALTLSQDATQTYLWPTADIATTAFLFNTVNVHTNGYIFEVQQQSSQLLTLDPSGDLYVTGNITCGGTCGGGGSSQWTNVTGGINYSGGKVGIGASSPITALDIEGDGTVLAKGTFGVGVSVPDLGAGTRMEWIPSRSAFRAGSVDDVQWDSSNTGFYSTAFGFDTIALGQYSTAFGNGSTVYGDNSVAFAGGFAGDTNTFSFNGFANAAGAVAFGSNSNATGVNSFAGPNATASGASAVAFGDGNTASGDNSTTFGRLNTASGDTSFAAGVASTATGTFSAAFGNTNAVSAASFTVGSQNIGGGTPGGQIIATDPLFEVGNGFGANVFTDAIIVLKNGHTGINMGTGTPTHSLDVGNSAVSGIVARFQNSTGTCDINPTATALSCSSDMTLKKNINNLSDNSNWSFNNNIAPANQSILADILALNPVNYNWNSEANGTSKHTGFIAQEVQQVFPDLVSQDPNTHLLSLNYIGILPYTVEAIKEMNLNITNINDLTKANTWRDAITNWLADTKNGIKTIFSDTVKTNNLCVGSVCVTQQQFLQMVQNSGGSPVSSAGGSSGPTTPAPSDDNSSQSPDVQPQSPEVQPSTPDSSASSGQAQDTPVTPSDDTQSPQ